MSQPACYFSGLSTIQWKASMKLLLVFAITTIPLTGVFIQCKMINPGLQIEQYVFYGKIMGWIGAGLLGMWSLSQPYCTLKDYLSIPDLLVVCYLIIALLTYNRHLNPAPERLVLLLQLSVLWFFLRITILFYPSVSVVWQFVFLLFAGMQAMKGMLQLSGYASSNHYLYGLSGSFFNPGPYSGYLAMVVPIAVYYIVTFTSAVNTSKLHYTTIYYYLSWAYLFFSGIALLAGRSRTAWIAATVSGLWVIGVASGWKIKLFLLWQRLRPKLVYWVAGMFLLIFLLFSLFFLFKKDSANGRFFLWKVDLLTWTQNRAGVGIGGFSAAYGVAQAKYFATHPYSSTEELVAGTPDYAFNEYLQILIEHAIWGLVIFLLFVIFVLSIGIKNRQTPWLGAFIALLIFSFASYPLQLPVFKVAFLFIAIGSLSPDATQINRQSVSTNNKMIYVLSIPLLLFTSYLSYCYKMPYHAYREWDRYQLYYYANSYEKVISKYEQLYTSLSHQPQFLFQYGRSLSQNGQLEAATAILERGNQLSNDPMFRNVAGRNFQQQKEYGKAEACYLESAHLLPGRLYPYYLLVKLYAEPSFFCPDKIEEYGTAVLNKQPKIPSEAVREMKEEVRLIMESRPGASQ